MLTLQIWGTNKQHDAMMQEAANANLLIKWQEWFTFQGADKLRVTILPSSPGQSKNQDVQTRVLKHEHFGLEGAGHSKHKE